MVADPREPAALMKRSERGVLCNEDVMKEAAEEGRMREFD